MRRSGLSVVSETAQGASHDPDFHGSATRANELHPRVAIEVHFDWSGGVDGFSGLYVSAQGQALAGHIGAAFKARDLPRAADVRRPELFFLNSTHMPALIPEIRRVHDFPDAAEPGAGRGPGRRHLRFPRPRVPAPAGAGHRASAPARAGHRVSRPSRPGTPR